MCALFPGAGSLPPLSATGVDAFLRRYRRESSLLLWTGLLLGSLVFTLTPLFTIGVPLPSFLLSGDALERHARKATALPIYVLRQAVLLVKMVGGLCWGSAPEVRKLFALRPYDPDPGTWREG